MINIFLCFIVKILTLGSYGYSDGVLIDRKDHSYIGEYGEKFYFSRPYWEACAKEHKLTKSDKEKLIAVGWEDLIS